MQEKYIGNERDYVKYALLRHLAEQMPEAKLGVNWYRFETNEENHGKMRKYLDNPEKWCGLDPKLFDALKAADFQNEENRKLSNIETLDIWPEKTVFYGKPVPRSMDNGQRGEWHQNAKAGLSEAEWLFLDPNTGGEIKSMRKAHAGKYVLDEELLDYAQEKITVFFQARGRFKWEDRVTERRQRYQCFEQHGVQTDLPVICGSDVLFFTFAPKEKAKAVDKYLRGFADKQEKIELIQLLE